MVAGRIFRQASPTEMTYIATDTIVVSRSSIAGGVSREQFEAAVTSLEARYRILRSVVLDGQFVERLDDLSAIESWLSSDTTSAEAVYAVLLNAKLDTRSSIYNIRRGVRGDTDADTLCWSAGASSPGADCHRRGSPAPDQHCKPRAWRIRTLASAGCVCSGHTRRGGRTAAPDSHAVVGRHAPKARAAGIYRTGLHCDNGTYYADP